MSLLLEPMVLVRETSQNIVGEGFFCKMDSSKNEAWRRYRYTEKISINIFHWGS